MSNHRPLTPPGSSLCAFPRPWLFRRWNGERWLVIGTRMYRVTRRGTEGKPLPRVTRTFARFEAATPTREPKPRPDGGQIHA